MILHYCWYLDTHVAFGLQHILLFFFSSMTLLPACLFSPMLPVPQVIYPHRTCEFFLSLYVTIFYFRLLYYMLAPTTLLPALHQLCLVSQEILCVGFGSWTAVFTYYLVAYPLVHSTCTLWITTFTIWTKDGKRLAGMLTYYILYVQLGTSNYLWLGAGVKSEQALEKYRDAQSGTEIIFQKNFVAATEFQLILDNPLTLPSKL